MLDRKELVEQLEKCADGELSVEDFEEWFDSASWNVHQQADEGLTSAVFEIESLHSAFQDSRIDRSSIRLRLRELAKAVRPFALLSRQLPHRMTAGQTIRYEASESPQEFTCDLGLTRKGIRLAFGVDSLKRDQVLDYAEYAAAS